MARSLRHLWVPLRATVVLLVLAGLGGLLVAGAAGAVGGVLGVILVAGSYAVSSVAVAWADSVAPQLVLTVGLATYAMKFSLLGAVVLLLPSAGWPGRTPMAVAMVVAILTWITAQVWWTMRAKIPYVEITN